MTTAAAVAPDRSASTADGSLDELPIGRAWWHVLRREWRWWTPGTLLSLLIANVLTGGWGHLLRPQLRVPLIYDGDGPWQALLVQRLREGWVTSNARMGWPFGSVLHDWPTSDLAHFLGTKALSLVTSSWVSNFNLYFVAGYPLVFVATYPTNRVFGLSRGRALGAALVFAFAPFHWMRLGHTFYTWYPYVPIAHLAALHLATAQPSPGTPRSYRGLLRDERGWWAVMLVISCFGIYPAVFCAITIAVGALVGCTVQRTREPMLRCTVAASGLLGGLALNTAPAVWHRLRSGANPEAASRFFEESELYALRLRQLLLPHASNPISLLRSVGRRFAGPEFTEGSTATLGIVAAVGLLKLSVIAFRAMGGRPTGLHERLLATQAIVLFLFGTVGGLGALFALTISPSIRGWSRISIFLAYPCTVAAMSLGREHRRRRSTASDRSARIVAALVLCTVTSFAVYEQNTWNADARLRAIESRFTAERSFVLRTEGLLRPGAAVYQLPYTAMPEGRPPARSGIYEQAYGFLHSRSLRWSWGGMRGRAADRFVRTLATRPPAEQVSVVRRLGFGAIAVNGRGFEDSGAATIAELTAILGAPAVSERGPDGAPLVLFRLPDGGDDLRGAELQTVMRRTGLLVDRLGRRVSGSLEEGIDFATDAVPAFVRDLRGLAPVESWGRWSDAHQDASGRIGFRDRLPAHALVELVLVPFGPNESGTLSVRLGDHEVRRRLRPGRNVLRFRVPNESTDTIELRPPSPVTPAALGMAPGFNRLGIGLVSLRVRCGAPCRTVVPATPTLLVRD